MISSKSLRISHKRQTSFTVALATKERGSTSVIYGVRWTLSNVPRAKAKAAAIMRRPPASQLIAVISNGAW